MAGQYGLSDLVVYRPETFYGLLERYHAALWPAHVVVVAVVIAALVASRRHGRNGDRFLLGALAGAWAVVAWRYFAKALASVHWAAPLFAAAWGAEALLLGGWAIFAKPGPDARRRWAGAFLAFFAVAVPLLEGLARGRPRAVSFVGLTPETTAAVTLVVLLLVARGRRRGLLAVLPVTWLAIALLQQAAWGGSEARLAGLCAAATLAIFLVDPLSRRVLARRPRLPQNPPGE